MADVVGVFQQAAANKKLQLISHIDQNLSDETFGDENRIRQVLQNLVQNAIKFTDTGSVEVNVSQVFNDNLREVRFTVSDTGRGISAADQKKLFQLFVQVDGSTKRQHSGTGLGLALSKRLVELMGGEIGVNSNDGSGTTFWFELPLKSEA